MKKKIFAAVMALCLVAGTSAFAQGPKQAPMTKERPTAEQMAQRKTERMTEKLGLNADQAKQIYALNLEQVKDMQAKHQEMRKAREAESAKMKAILTPEQYKQWEEMRGPKSGDMHNRMGKGGKDCCQKGGDKPCPMKDKK